MEEGGEEDTNADEERLSSGCQPAIRAYRPGRHVIA